MKYLAQIPARLGSKRVAQKNIRMINNQPLIYYSIKACKESKYIDTTIVNSEGEIIKRICKENNVKFYDRPRHLLGDDIVQDDFNYDFLKNFECENMILVNSVSPLIEGKDIDNAINYFEKNTMMLRNLNLNHDFVQ